MKQSRLANVLLCAATVFLLTSCGGNESKESSNDAITGDSNSTVKNTIVTAPQNMMIVTHNVADLDKWRSSYDEHDSMGLANGIHNYVIGRGLENSNMVLVALKGDDVVKIKSFADNPSLKKAMQKGGVTGTPSMSFLMAKWQDTAVISSPIRSLTTFKVKDWDAWQKSFQEGRQERADNGITDRVYGHDVDDNKKVSLVTAVLDTAKAFAYYKSDALKKRRQAGGVIGEPKRFLFTIVKRY